MRKHTRRNTYDAERASAAAVRKAQPRSRQSKTVTPEHQALLELSAKIRRLRLHGEQISAEMDTEYNRLLRVHWAQQATQSTTQQGNQP